MLGSVTLLPALLGFVGRNIDRFGLPAASSATTPSSFWHRWAAVVQKRPVAAFLGALALLILIVLALPVVSLRLGFGDAGNKPDGDTSRQAYDLLAEGFGPGFNGPLLLAAETPDGAADLAVLERLSGDPEPDAGRRRSRRRRGRTPPATPRSCRCSPRLTAGQGDRRPRRPRPRRRSCRRRSRDRRDVAVGGFPAAVDDFANYTLPACCRSWSGSCCCSSFMLLMLVFRSILVPLKAVIMNLLSVGAAYGVMVAVFQWGWGTGLIGVGKEGPIEAWVADDAVRHRVRPLDGLRGVPALAHQGGVRPHRRQRHAVADGLAATARVITAAAAIMVCVFGALRARRDRALKLFGLGLAVAVLIDATIVRLVLVPATMELLGDRNWWIPKWLDRILPQHPHRGPPATSTPSSRSSTRRRRSQVWAPK